MKKSEALISAFSSHKKDVSIYLVLAVFNRIIPYYTVSITAYYTVPPGKESRHHGCPRWRAHGRGRVKVGKRYAYICMYICIYVHIKIRICARVRVLFMLKYSLK